MVELFFGLIALGFLVGFPTMIIQEIFEISFEKSFLVCFSIGIVICGAGFGWWLWSCRQNYEIREKVESYLIGALIAFLITNFLGFFLIGKFVFVFIKDPQIALSVTSVLSIGFFFIILNTAHRFYAEEEGFIAGTKAWFRSIPFLPVFILLSFLSLIFPVLNPIFGFLFLIWLIYFFGYPLLRGARTMDNIKRKKELKDFAAKYQEAAKEGTNFPEAPVRNIPQISGMISGWFSKLRAKDAVEIAEAHSQISRYAVDTVRNETDFIIEQETREQKIQLAKDELRWKRGKGERDDQMGYLSLYQMELENENLKEEREIKKHENQKRLKELEKQAEMVDEKPEEDPSQEEANEEAKDPFQANFERAKNEGDAKLGEAFGRYDRKRKGFQRLQQMRDEITKGRPLEALSESEKHELEDLEDYFYNEILPKL
jgi:hypothetical protein